MVLHIIEKRIASFLRTPIGRSIYCRNRENCAEDIFIPEMDHKNIYKISQFINNKGYETKMYENDKFNHITSPFGENQMLTLVIIKK